MYFTSGIMAISLLAYSCMIFLKRERGLDFSKMKWLREVFPRHLVLIALGCSIVFSLLLLLVFQFALPSFTSSLSSILMISQQGDWIS